MEGIIELQKEPIIHNSRKPTEGSVRLWREREGAKTTIRLLKWGRKIITQWQIKTRDACVRGVKWKARRKTVSMKWNEQSQRKSYVTKSVTCPPGLYCSNAIWTSSVEPSETISPSSSLYFTRNGPSSRRGPQSLIFLPTFSTKSPYSVDRGTWITKMSSWKWTLTFTGGDEGWTRVVCDIGTDLAWSYPRGTTMPTPPSEDSLDPKGVIGDEEVLGE